MAESVFDARAEIDRLQLSLDRRSAAVRRHTSLAAKFQALAIEAAETVDMYPSIGRSIDTTMLAIMQSMGEQASSEQWLTKRIADLKRSLSK